MNNHKTPLIAGLIYFILVYLNACSTIPGQISDTELLKSGTFNHDSVENDFWWNCRFKISWPPETVPDFSIDLMIAHAIIAPELKEQLPNIAFWRFHRRAAPDDAGHQFSFIFYSPPEIAKNIMESVKHNHILGQLLSEGIIETIHFDDPAYPARPDIEDTSDSNWSEAIQINWPSYIMGVSAFWLGLIDTLLSNDPATGDTAILLERYRKANNEINSLWKNQGQHALLHHLNAIFGYESLTIKKEIQF